MMGAAISRDEIERRVRELGNWFHNLDLNGVQTAPNHFLGDYPRIKWDRFAHAIPEDLRGSAVLDIGCNAGFYSIEMKRRGADRVVGIDCDPALPGTGSLRNSPRATSSFASSVYQLPVLEHFDIVLFMGVLYHLRYPLLALDMLHHHARATCWCFSRFCVGLRR